MALREEELLNLSVAKFDQLIRTGFFSESMKVELIEGIMVKQMSRIPPHDYAVTQLHGFSMLLVAGTRIVRNQCSLRLPRSVPEPDLVVVPGPASRYAKDRPRWTECELLVEVADTSLAFDQGRKLQMYARAQLPEYWIVNLVDRRVEVHTQPKRGKKPTYQSRIDYTVGQSVPVVLGGKPLGIIPVSEILP